MTTEASAVDSGRPSSRVGSRVFCRGAEDARQAGSRPWASTPVPPATSTASIVVPARRPGSSGDCERPRSRRRHGSRPGPPRHRRCRDLDDGRPAERQAAGVDDVDLGLVGGEVDHGDPAAATSPLRYAHDAPHVGVGPEAEPEEPDLRGPRDTLVVLDHRPPDRRHEDVLALALVLGV